MVVATVVPRSGATAAGSAAGASGGLGNGSRPGPGVGVGVGSGIGVGVGVGLGVGGGVGVAVGAGAGLAGLAAGGFDPSGGRVPGPPNASGTTVSAAARQLLRSLRSFTRLAASAQAIT